MSHLTSLLLHPDAFDGHDAQRYFASHTALPLSVVVLYLAMVRYLPRYMHTRPPYELRFFSRCWNLSVAAFSVCGMLVCVPHLASQLLEHGFYYTVCRWVNAGVCWGGMAMAWWTVDWWVAMCSVWVSRLSDGVVCWWGRRVRA